MRIRLLLVVAAAAAALNDKCNILVQLFKWMLSTTDREISRSLSSIFDATTAGQFGQERAVLLYLR
jgi:hypothetical protein